MAEEEGIALHVAADINHWDAVRVEYARPWVDVVHLDLGLARDITVDDENVRLGPGLPKKEWTASADWPEPLKAMPLLKK